VIAILFATMISGRPPVIFGDGEQSRDFTFVANVVHANLLAMYAADVAGNVYNIACGERVTVNQLVRELQDLLEVNVEPAYAAPRPGEVRDSLADLSRARRELGYEPVVGLREGLERTIEHFRAQEHAPDADSFRVANEP